MPVANVVLQLRELSGGARQRIVTPNSPLSRSGEITVVRFGALPLQREDMSAVWISKSTEKDSDQFRVNECV